MTLASETESPEQAAAAPESGRVRDPEFPYEVEMTLMEHLEELRSRLLASVIAVAICIIACFVPAPRSWPTIAREPATSSASSSSGKPTGWF